MLWKLLEKQKKSIDHFFASLKMQEVEMALKLFSECQGTIIFSGVGKSGLVAEKCAATLTSTGSPALFLCPMNAIHGDLGLVREGDLFVAFSKSGQSHELIDLIPFIKKKGALVIAVVSEQGSKLEKEAFLTVHLPVDQELCPFDLAPTTSTAIQMMFGDLMAVALMEKKNFSRGDFADNHPGGLLGKKITLRVADLMFKGSSIPLCRPTDTLIDQLHNFSAKKCGCLIVTDAKGELQGIFTDGDLRRSIETKGPKALESRLEELMTRSPKSITAQKLAVEAIHAMEEEPKRLITVLPVLEGAKVIGLIRMHDIIQAGLYRKSEEEHHRIQILERPHA